MVPAPDMKSLKENPNLPATLQQYHMRKENLPTPPPTKKRGPAGQPSQALATASLLPLPSPNRLAEVIRSPRGAALWSPMRGSRRPCAHAAHAARGVSLWKGRLGPPVESWKGTRYFGLFTLGEPSPKKVGEKLALGDLEAVLLRTGTNLSLPAGFEPWLLFSFCFFPNS